jgi:hypothetical protein
MIPKPVIAGRDQSYRCERRTFVRTTDDARTKTQLHLHEPT